MSSLVWYIYIALTVSLEAIGFYFLNKANWFENLKFLFLWLIFFNATTVCFAMALKTIDLTIWNVLWASCSLIMSSAIWYFIFSEKYNLVQYWLILLILICIVLLNISGIKK